MSDGADLWMSCSLPLYAVRVGAVAALITALFFIGPALAAQASKRTLMGVIEDSLGSIPAYLLRVCCVLFLLIWLTRLIAWSGWVLAVALWGRAAASAMPGRLLVAAITMFGAMRFGLRALVDLIPARLQRDRRILMLAGCLGGTLLCVINRNDTLLDKPFDLLTLCLAVMAAVLTADFVARRWRGDGVRRFDWVGVAALAAGLVTPLCLPSYAVGVVVCLSGRALHRLIHAGA